MMKKTILLAFAGLLGMISCSTYDYYCLSEKDSYPMDGSASYSSIGGPNGQGRPGWQAGVLTAGEWNDLAHWDFWSGLMTSQD